MTDNGTFELKHSGLLHLRTMSSEERKEWLGA